MPVKPTEKEEEYYAKMEFERKQKLELQKQRALSEEQRKRSQELHRMKCPKCGMELIEIDYGVRSLTAFINSTSSRTILRNCVLYLPAVSINIDWGSNSPRVVYPRAWLGQFLSDSSAGPLRRIRQVRAIPAGSAVAEFADSVWNSVAGVS
jgi:hypothetical protein